MLAVSKTETKKQGSNKVKYKKISSINLKRYLTYYEYVYFNMNIKKYYSNV